MPILRTRWSRHSGVWVLLSIVAGLAPATAALAQTSGAMPQQGVAVPVLNANAKRHVDVSLNGSFNYDSNASRSNAIRLPPPNLKKADSSLTLGTNVDITLPAGRNVFTLTGFAGYNFNQHNKTLNSENIGLNGGYQRFVDACAVSLTGGYHRGQTQFALTSFTNLTKNLETTSTVGGSLACGNPVGFHPFVSAAYSHATNSQLVRQFNDHDIVTYGAGLVFSQPTLGDIGLIASINDTKFPQRSSSGLNGSHAIKSKSVGLYFNRTAARILQARVQVNYTLVSDDKTNNSFSGISGTVDVHFSPGGRFKFNLTGGRAVVPSLSYNANYLIDTTYGLSVSAPITPKILAQLGYSADRRKYAGVPSNSLHPLLSDTNKAVSLTLDYAIVTKVDLAFGASYQSRTANDPFFNYSGVRVTMGVNVHL